MARQVIGGLWSRQWPSLAPSFKRLARTDGGRHGRHTQAVFQTMDALLAGPQHLAWPSAISTAAWPELVGEVADPDILRAVALLHDLGKIEGLSRHEEHSYRLFVRAVPPTGDKTIAAALLIRHHNALGCLQTGEASRMALLPLITDVRRHAIAPATFLAGLTLLTLADWAAYDMLSPGVVKALLAQATALRQPFWWSATPAEITERLQQQAVAETVTRLHNLLVFAFRTPVEFAGSSIEQRIDAAGIDWASFQRQFVRLRFDGGWSVFEHALQWTGSAEAQFEFFIPHLCRWLPPPNTSALYRVDLRALAAASPEKLVGLLNLIEAQPEKENL